MLEFFKARAFQGRGVGMSLNLCSFTDCSVNLATSRIEIQGESLLVLNFHLTSFSLVSEKRVFNTILTFY